MPSCWDKLIHTAMIICCTELICMIQRKIYAFCSSIFLCFHLEVTNLMNYLRSDLSSNVTLCLIGVDVNTFLPQSPPACHLVLIQVK